MAAIDAAAAARLLGSELGVSLRGDVALYVLSGLQLALRHPAYRGSASADMVERFARELADGIARVAPAFAGVCAAGWLAELDQPPGRRRRRVRHRG